MLNLVHTRPGPARPGVHVDAWTAIRTRAGKPMAAGEPREPPPGSPEPPPVVEQAVVKPPVRHGRIVHARGDDRVHVGGG